jgi:chloride channel 7
MGVILRADLLHVLLRGTALQRSDSFDPDALRRAYEFDVIEFSVAAMKEVKLSDLPLGEEELDMFLDLGPYVNPAPYIVQADTSLSKVYNMFRQLNLRHLCVVPHVNDVIGIITRKDLHPEIVEVRQQGGGNGTFLTGFLCKNCSELSTQDLYIYADE